MTFSLTVLGFIFITGLIIGSFLNVVILRTVSEESIIFPASKCPKCQTPLKWYHNIPLLSYIFLRGKCAYCKERISPQYPFVELLTGIIFVGLFLKFCHPFDEFYGLEVMYPITWMQIINYIFMLIASCLFIVIAGTDIKEMKVADKHTYSLIGTGIVFSIIISVFNYIMYTKANGAPKLDWHLILTCPVLYAIGGSILFFGIMEILRKGTTYILKTETFGDGDSYIAAGIGAMAGALFASKNTISNNPALDLTISIVGILLLSFIVAVVIIFPSFIKNLIKSRNWMTLGALAAFVIYATGFVFALDAGWLENKVAYISSAIVMVLLGLLACKELLSGIKQRKTTGTMFPFGPSLVIAAFIMFLL